MRIAQTALLALLVGLSATASAEPLKVFYAGFSFVGERADNLKAFRYTQQLLEEKSGVQPRLEVELKRRVDVVRNPSFELISDRLAVREKGDSVALVFALEWENVSVEKGAGVSKLVVDIHAQVLVFDFDARKLISTHPVAVQVRDVVRGEVTEDHKRRTIRDIYYGTGTASIFDQFATRLAAIPLKTSYGNRLRVGSVVLDDNARATVSGAGADPDAFGRFAAQSFGRFLSQNMGVSVLPYSAGEAIGRKMTVRFANADLFQLTIPEADYAVNLRLRGFKKVMLGQNHAERVWGYGSFAAVTLEDPEFRKRYFENDFKFAAVKRVPVSVSEIDDWSAYQESLFTLFDQLTRQFAQPSPDWLKRWAGGEDVAARIAEAAKVIETCR